jgi:hypothetical protein
LHLPANQIRQARAPRRGKERGPCRRRPSS